MSDWRSRAGVGLVAALLASLLSTATVASALAATGTTNANPSVIVQVGMSQSVGISYTWSGGPGDTIAPVGTKFVVTLPPGYEWTVVPTLVPSVAGISLSGPVGSHNGLAETWSLTSFSPNAAWTLALTGGTVVATATAGTGPITLEVGTAPPVQIASLTSSYGTGTAVPLTISPIAAPADGASVITLTFGAPTVTCASTASFTVATTRGTFTTTTLPGVSSPVNGISATILCGNFATVAGRTLTLRAPTKPATASVTVTLAGATATDSSATVTFTPVAGGSPTIGGKGHGAAKVAFYSVSTTPNASGCATAPATATAGAKTYGFAVMTATGSGRLNVEVSLKSLPAGVYTVALYQAAGASCTHASIRINARGNGNRHFRLTLAGTTQVWATASGAAGVFVTPAVTVAVKTHGRRDGDNNGQGKPAGRQDDD